MLNVFVISSDKRIERLIAFFQPFFKTKIRSASDFDQGLKEVFENRPSMVLIQSMIGTVSGETVARHIKSLLGSDAPRIVFMGDDEDKGKKGTSWCDEWLYTGSSEQQLQQDFSNLIARSFPEDWRYIQSELERTLAPGLEEAADVAELPGEAVSEDDTPNPDASVGTTSISAQGELQEHVPGKDFDVPSLDRTAHEEQDLGSCRILDMESSFEAVSSRPERRATGKYLVVFLLLAAMVAGIYLWLSRPADHHGVATIPPSPAIQPATDEHAAVPAVTARHGFQELPSFIRSEWLEPGYSAQHPGWERYVSTGAEFLLFRENDTIKALQVISRDKDGISDTFLGSVVKQFGYDGPFPAGKEIQKNGFRITSIVFPGLAELVVYREQGQSQIQAFVLEFS